MQVVEKATMFHAQCAITKKGGGRMVDTGLDFDVDHQGRFYISVQAVKDMARLRGIDLRSAEELGEARTELDLALTRVDELEAQLAEADQALEAVHTLTAKGYTSARKPGRPKKEPVEA